MEQMNAEGWSFPAPPPTPDIEPGLRVGFILSPGFNLMPFAAFFDRLRHAAGRADFSRQVHCHWTIVAPTMQPVTASCGVEVSPHALLADTAEFDYLVVVAGVLPASLAHPEETLRFLRTAYEQGTTLVGLCTASFVLAKAGLLDGRRCALPFEHIGQFRKMFPRAVPEGDRALVEDQRIITCPGGPCAFDVALDLIELRCGRARANKVVRSLFVDRRRAARRIPVRPYGDLAACGNWHVEQAMSLMEQNLSMPHSVREMVRLLNTSERVLYRAFRKHAGDTPAEVSRRLRLAHGQWLLASTTRTVANIAAACGFADAAHFCRLFKRVYGETPSRFRDLAASNHAAQRA